MERRLALGSMYRACADVVPAGPLYRRHQSMHLPFSLVRCALRQQPCTSRQWHGSEHQVQWAECL